MSVISIRPVRHRKHANLDCAKCAQAMAMPRVRRAGVRDDVLTWAGTLTGAAVVVAFGTDAARWFGVGVVMGLLVSVICAWATIRAMVRSRTEHHRHTLSALTTDADERVASIVRQFEWAVNDIARLKRDAERAGLTAEILLDRSRDRDRYVAELERELNGLRERLAINVAPRRDIGRSEFSMDVDEIPTVPFFWGLHHDGYGVNLELEVASRTHHPVRVRIVDKDGAVVLTSGMPFFSEDETAGFTLSRPPVAMLVDLDTGRVPTYRLEALVDLEWMPVRLSDTGRRTKSSWDKHGRMYRVASEQRTPPQPTIN